MWRSRMFWQLFGTYGFLLAAALVLGWMLHRHVQAYLLDETRQSLALKTVLVRELVASQAMDSGERQKQVSRLAEETQTRITLIAADGTVLADSAEHPDHMQNLLDQPEIQGASAGGVGSATHDTETADQRVMYVARQVDSGGIGYVRVARSLGAVEAEVRWLQQLLWVGLGSSLVVALLLSLVLAWRMSAPLIELAEAARSMAQGCYGQRTMITSRGEIGTLVTAFNEMSEACASHVSQMQQEGEQLRAILRSMVGGVVVIDADQHIRFLNDAAAQAIGLPPEAAEGQKLWKLLRHRQLAEMVDRVLSSDAPQQCELEWTTGQPRTLAVQGARIPGTPVRGAVLVLHDITDLRRLERVRQDFVVNASHELKTPLAVIQATVETLLDGALADPGHNTRFLESIRESAERLHHLVQDMLTLSRIESGQEAMELRPIPVQAAVDACVSRQEPRAAAKNLRIMKSPSPEALSVIANDEALAEILENVVDNAIKYTPPGGQITLHWFAEGDQLVLQVDDTGVGIAEKDLPRIFERFYRADRARSREMGGTGLGLSIVKHLVQALGGSVAARSRLGEGSTFTVRLPLARDVPVSA